MFYCAHDSKEKNYHIVIYLKNHKTSIITKKFSYCSMFGDEMGAEKEEVKLCF